MAQCWLHLAAQAEKNLNTVIVYENRIMTDLMSVRPRISDSSQTSRHFRKGPQTEMGVGLDIKAFSR
jgi:hypothetical protein